MKTDNQRPNDNDAVVTSDLVQQMSHHNVHGCRQEDSSARRPRRPRCRRYVWVAVVMASLVSFSLGFWISERIRTRREVEQEWQRLFSILQWGLEEGKVDEAWMRELEIIKHESEWNDD